jgi:hypothetical protein
MNYFLNILLLTLIKIYFCFKCGFNDLKLPKNDTFVSIYDDNDTRLREIKESEDDSTEEEVEYEPIRIFLDTEFIENQTQINKTLKTKSLNILKSAIDLLQQIVMVKRETAKLVFNSSTIFNSCDNITISNDLAKGKGTGVEADLILLAKFTDNELGTNVQAAATYCALDPDSHRPLVGYVLINSSLDLTTMGNSEEYLKLLFIHEITHVLVFHPNLWTSHYVPVRNGENYTKTKEINGIKRTLISSPYVLEAAKKHFGCSKIEGIELENQGGTGTSGSHWESRVMLGDLMIGFDYSEIYLSEITLGLFNDSGWYKVNDYTGGLFRHGKNQKCDFLEDKCVQKEATPFLNEFCVDKAFFRCGSSRLTRSFCYLVSYTSDVPTEYQYFSDKEKGGYSYADYCPISMELLNSTMYLPGSCKYGSSLGYENIGEVVGKNSICVLSSLVGSNETSIPMEMLKNRIRPMCYPISCNANTKTVTVTILKTKINCPTEGGQQTVDGYDGVIYCPDYNAVCTGTVFCNSLIECIEKKSLPLDESYKYSYTPNNQQDYKSYSTNYAHNNYTNIGANTDIPEEEEEEEETKSKNNGKFIKPYFMIFLYILSLLL